MAIFNSKLLNYQRVGRLIRECLRTHWPAFVHLSWDLQSSCWTEVFFLRQTCTGNLWWVRLYPGSVEMESLQNVKWSWICCSPTLPFLSPAEKENMKGSRQIVFRIKLAGNINLNLGVDPVLFWQACKTIPTAYCLKKLSNTNSSIAKDAASRGSTARSWLQARASAT